MPAGLPCWRIRKAPCLQFTPQRHRMGEMGNYQLFGQGGKEIGGIYTLQPGVTTPHWLSYVRVSDVDKAANAAKAAGGRVINGPMEVPGGDWIAQIIDPQGAAGKRHSVRVHAARLRRKRKRRAPQPGRVLHRASVRRPQSVRRLKRRAPPCGVVRRLANAS
jgi:predicted enzyme related to lactoylglutathione lyase